LIIIIYNLFFVATDGNGNQHELHCGTFNSLGMAIEFSKKEIKRGLQNKVKGYDFGPYYLSNGAETLNTYLHNIDEKDVVRLPDCALGFVVRCHSKNEGIKVF
jgi:hypothetical protein